MANKNFSERRRRAEITDEYAFLENFHPCADGGIEKRAGIEKISEFPANIYSAVNFSMSSVSENSDDLLVAAPPYIYEYKLRTRQMRELLNYPSSNTKHVSIATNGSNIYYFNGSKVQIYDYLNSRFRDCEGYAPLYGKSWDPELGGKVNEERNLLCGNLRINYRVQEAATSLYLGLYPGRIFRLEIDGVATSDFTLNGDRITGDFPEKSSVDVWLKMSHSGNSLTKTRSFCKLEDGCFVAYNSTTAPHEIFWSKPVSAGALEASRLGFPSSDELYFPQNYKKSFRGIISAVAPCRDKLVIFTNERAWLGNINQSSVELSTLSDCVGCIDPRAVLCRGSDIYTVSERGAFKLSVNFREPSETEAELLFEPPENLSAGSYSIFEDPIRSEIMFSCYGRIFVYNTKTKKIHIYPDMTAAYGQIRKRETVIFEGNKVWSFSGALELDSNGDQELPITAVARTEWLDLGESETEKHTLTVHPVFTLKNDGYFELLIETDSGLCESYKISARGGDVPRHRSIRIAACRFKSVRVSVISSGAERPRISGIVLTSLKGRN